MEAQLKSLKKLSSLFLILLILIPFCGLKAQDGLLVPTDMPPTPLRGPDEGEGPYNTLVIRGAMMIDGSGAAAKGPVEITIKNNIIDEIKNLPLGYDCSDSRQATGDTHVIEACGMYITPGFISVHEHIDNGGNGKLDGNASYAYKLFLAHGITTIKGVPLGPMDWSLKEQQLSEENKIVAPRLIPSVNPKTGMKWGKGQRIDTPQDMRDYVDYAKGKGITLFGEIGAQDPDMMEALFSQAKKQGIWTMDHLDQQGVVRMTAADAVKLGLDEVTHYYGYFESMLTDHSVQDWPIGYNYTSNLDRFSNVGRLADQSAEPGSEKWNDLINLFLEHKTVLSPTFSIYAANRNVMNARNSDWWADYTLPSLWDFIVPNRVNHASYFWDYTSRDEAAWQKFYQKWFRFIKDYNDAGGRVAAGSDTSFLYQLFGFSYIRELVMLEYAGLTPYEVLRSATLYGAETIFQPHKDTGKPIEYGLIRRGLKADLQIFTKNPMYDFKLLYGTGSIRINKNTDQPERVRILKYVIKDGIIYDPEKLLADVREMVKEAWDKKPSKTNVSLPQPMLHENAKLWPEDKPFLYYEQLSRENNMQKP